MGYLYVCTFISFFFQLLEDRGEKRLISKYFLFLTRRSWNIFYFREDEEREREKQDRMDRSLSRRGRMIYVSIRKS